MKMNYFPEKIKRPSKISQSKEMKKLRIRNCLERVKQKLKDGKGTELGLKGSTRCFKVSITMPHTEKPEEVEKINFLVKQVMQNKDFKREYKLLRRINHENIVRFHGYFVIGNYYCLVLEYMSVPLKKCLKKGLFKFKRLVKSIVFQILQALYYLHKNKIIHRDISDNNIMLTKMGRVKLIDFDSSKDTASTGRPQTTTGTPGFQSPEVLMFDTDNYESRMDIFALGLVAYLCYYGSSFHYDCMNPFDLYKHMVMKIEELGRKRDFASMDERMFHKFLVCCLRVDPKERLRAADLLQLEWFEEMWELVKRGKLYKFTREALRDVKESDKEEGLRGEKGGL